jgi:hypothetical protein
VLDVPASLSVRDPVCGEGERRTVAALVPGREEVVVAAVLVDGRRLDRGRAARPLRKRRDVVVLELARVIDLNPVANRQRTGLQERQETHTA